MMVEAPSPPTILSPNHYEGGNKPIRFIVVHCTVSPCKPGEARDIAHYFQSEDAGASAHYNTDPGETIQCVWDSDRAWHAGSEGNKHSLGLELCSYVDDVDWGDANHEDMLARAADLVSQLCDAYDIPKNRIGPDELASGASGICGHVDVRDGLGGTTHYDPGEAFPWDHFMRMVRGGATTSEEDLDVDEQTLRTIVRQEAAAGVQTMPIPTPHVDGKDSMYFEWVISQSHNRSGGARAEAREDRVTEGAPERQEVRELASQVAQLHEKLDQVLEEK